MRLLLAFAAALLLASGAEAQTCTPNPGVNCSPATKAPGPVAGMFTYTGQDAPNAPTFQIIPNSQAAAAQALFLEDLDPATISFFDFEGLTPDNTDTTPARAVNNAGSLTTIARFDAYGASGEIPTQVIGRNEAVVRLVNNTNQIGTWATSGSQYLLAAAYDGDNFTGGTAGTTQLALRLQYDAASVSAGRTPKPFSSFGAYITDTEGYGTIRLVLTPFGGGTQVIVDYNGILNQGITTTGRGNGQLTFVGFTDYLNQYQTIDIFFTNRKTPADPAQTVTNEAFGFDDFIVGEVNQVLGPEETAVTERVLDQVDEPGWRLLSAPVRGVTVDDLAQQNLVQGVPAGSETPAQYPEAGSNFYWAYGGGTRWDYIPVPTTDTVLRPGRGFWWYWYDLDLTPNPTGAGGGTSVSVELDNFQLSADGSPLTGLFTESFEDNTNCSSDPNEPCPAGRTRNGAPPAQVELPTGTQTPRSNVTPADDDYYMVGNPFPFPMDFSAITASGGTLAAQGVIWNPDNQSGTFPRTGEDIAFDGPGTYEIVFATPPPGGGGQGAVAVWNGVLVEVSKTDGQVGQPVIFTFDPVVAATSEDPPFHGKSETPEAYIRFGLFGETASGGKTRDEIAYLRFTDSATFGWDPTDASKPAWPGGPLGLVAPMGERNGEAHAQAVLARPLAAAAGATPLSLLLSETGEYELVWRSTGLTGTVRDLVTGDVVDLSAERYRFSAEGNGEVWTERFVVETSAATGTEAPEASSLYVGAPMPNPATGAFALDVRLGAAAEATVSVYDALGRRVAEQTARLSASGESVRVSTAGFAPGAYLVVVEAPGVRETRRVTVLR